MSYFMLNPYIISAKILNVIMFSFWTSTLSVGLSQYTFVTTTQLREKV